MGLREGASLRRALRRRALRPRQAASGRGRFIGVWANRVGGAPVEPQGAGESVSGDGATRGGPRAAVSDDGAGANGAEGGQRGPRCGFDAFRVDSVIFAVCFEEFIEE